MPRKSKADDGSRRDDVSSGAYELENGTSLNAIIEGSRWMHLPAATASAALARLPLQIFCCRKAKDYGECDLECVHTPMHVEVSVIADSRKIGEGRRTKIMPVASARDDARDHVSSPSRKARRG